MENKDLNKPTNDNLFGLNLDEISTPSLEEMEGKEVTDVTNETDPPVKKVTKAKQARDIGVPEGSLFPASTNVKTSDPLSGIENFVQGQVQSNQPKPIQTDLEEYAPYFGNNIGYVTENTMSELDKSRAYQQSGISQFKNAVGRIALNVIPEVASQIGNAFDVEDYLNADAEVGNWLSNAMKGIQENVNEALPIYRENPNENLDFGDSGYWFENGSSLVQSMLGFVGAGYVTGGVGSATVTRGAKTLKWLQTLGKTSQLGAEGLNATRVATTITNALMLNQAESIGIGVDTFNEVYQRETEKIQGSAEGLKMSSADIDKEARQRAADAASNAVMYNKWNVLLNLSSANLFLKPLTSTRNLISKGGLGKTLGTIGLEGAQEGAEELGNMYSQAKATSETPYGFKEALADTMSAEGAENFLLGFIGGAGQTALTKAGKSIPMYQNIAYKEAYNNAYNSLEKSDLTDTEKSAEATKIALEKVGTNKNRVSANFLEDSKYIQQQDQLARYNELGMTGKLDDIATSLANAQETVDLQAQIVESERLGQTAKKNALQSILVSNMARQAFQSGTTEGLLDLYKGFESLTNEEAAERGLYEEGQENTPDYFKTKAKAIQEQIKDLEKIYVNSQAYINSNQVYDLEEQNYTVRKEIDNNLKAIESKFAEAEARYKGHDTLDLGNGGYRGADTASGYDLNKVAPRFKKTPLYRQLHALLKADSTLRDVVNDYESIISSVTSNKFQNDLRDKIRKARETERKNWIKKDIFKKKTEAKKVVNDLVNNLKKPVEVDTAEDVVDEVDTAEKVKSPEEGAGIPLKEKEERDVVSEEEVPIVSSNRFEPIIGAGMEMVNNAFNNVNDFLDSNASNQEKLAYVNNAYNNFSLATDAVASSTSPLEGNKFVENLRKMESILSEYQRQIQTDNANAELKRQAQEFMDSLDSPDVEENLSADVQDETPDFEKASRQVTALSGLLKTMSDNGININNFRDVITALEINTSAEEVREKFDTIKYIYNLTTQQRNEGTYEELMYDDYKREEVVNRNNKLQLYSKPKDVYISDLNETEASMVATYDELAKLNGVDTSAGAFGSTLYNETASNKLAYLAKLYNVEFTPQKSASGKTFISVDKVDISDLLNSMLDHRVLNPNVFRVGTEIKFVPLNEVTLEDGSIRTAAESTIDNTPIGVELDGTLVEGLYLHDVSWLNRDNLDNTSQGINADQNKLRAFRQLVLDTPGGITTKITNRSIGVPILNSSSEITTVADNTPELSIGVVRNGKIYTTAQSSAEVINKNTFKEGKGVLLVPVNGKTLALGIDRAKLNDSHINSMTTALALYLDGVQTDITKQLKNQYEIDILTSKGLEQYFNNFISLTKLKANDLNSYSDALVDIADNISLAQFSNGTLLYGTGQSIGVNAIRKQDIGPNQRQQAVSHFRQHLKGMYSHINLDLMGTDTVIPIITEEGIETPFESYDDYAKSVMLSPYLGMELNDGTKVYTIQSRLHFDLETPFKTNKPKVEENIVIGTDVEGENITTFTNQDLSKRVELPNGKSFSFDDVTDDDFSPTIEEEGEFDYLANSTDLIKGLSVTSQNSIIKSITNDAYQEMLASGNIDIKKQVKLNLEAFELKRQLAYDINHPRKEEISKQIDVIIANGNLITDLVRKEFSKKKGINSVQTAEDSNNEFVMDEDEVNSKSLFLENDYTIDPKTGITDEVKQFLEGVRDMRIVRDAEGVVSYKPRTNLIGLNNYVSFDEVFNQTMSILSRSNDNTQELDSNLATDETFGEDTPMYVKHILRTLSNHVESKPFLNDVIDKLSNAEPHLQNAFATAFNKLHTNHIYLQSSYDSDEKSYSITANVAASRNTTNLVLSEWQNNLKYSNLLSLIGGKPVLNPSAINYFIKTYNDIINQEVELGYNTVSNWLNSVGVEIPFDLYNQLELKGVKLDDGEVQSLYAMFTSSNGIFKNIYDRARQFNTEDSTYLDLDTNSLFDDGAFRNLARLVSYYKKDLFNDSFRNGNGDTVYGFSNIKYAITRFLKLKSDEGLLNNLKNDIFSGTSSWLNDMTKTENGVLKINKDSYIYKQFKYYTSDSLKTRSSNIGKTIDRLSPAELEKYHLGLFMNRGAYVGKKTNPTPIMKVLYQTMSDKANTFVLQVPGKIYSLNEEGDLSEKTRIALAKQLIQPEVDRVLAFQRNPNAVDIKEYKAGAGKFLLFPQLNDDVRLWNEDGTLKEEVGVKGIYESIFARAIRNYIVSMTQEKIENWKELDIIRNNRDTKQDVLQYVDKTYKRNFSLDTTNGIRDFAMNYVINTLVANMNIQQLFIGDPASFFKTNAVLTADNQGKRLAGDNAGQNPIISNPNETFNTLVIKDVKSTSTSYDYIKSLIGEKAEDYAGITASDAQAYTTLEEHLFIMNRKGELPTSSMNRILDIYNKTGKVSKADLKKVLQPMKPVYVNNIQRGGDTPINTRLYLKYSSIPLIKEFTQGRGLDGLRELMENNNIQLAIYESGAKVGMPSSIPNIFNGEAFNLDANWKNGLIENIPREGLGIQNEVPYDPNQNEVNDGTQQSKLLFTNILDVAGFVNPITEEKVTGRELSKTYLDTYKQLFENKQKQLLKELDYDFKTNTLKNIKKLQKIIIQEGLGRGYSTNDLAAFNLDELGENFSTPLWLNNSSGKIESLINSIVDNRVRKRKFRGKSFVLASGVGTNLISQTDADMSGVIKVGDWDGKLKAVKNINGKMTYAEILIPFKFWDNSGNLLKVKDFMNEDGTIDLRRLPEKALEIFGYRIPTSGINLLSTLKVVGFLPDTMGDTVIAPDDFIVQMGSDFDVDKLYTHMYNTHYNSVTKALEIVTPEIANKVKIVRDTITALKKRIANGETDASIEQNLAIHQENELLQLKSVDNMILENRLVDLHKAVLNNPAIEVQRARVKPLSFGGLPELAKRFNVDGVSKWFTPLSNTYQINKYLSARAGKTAVGIFSLDMVFNSAMQYVEQDMHFTYVEDKVRKNYKLTLSGKTNNVLNKTTVIGSKDKFKSDVLEGFMTAALDNEKEQLLGKLNINTVTFDFIRAMTQMGFEEDVTLTYINQPVIKKLVKERGLGTFIDAETFTGEMRGRLSTMPLTELEQAIKDGDASGDVQEAILAMFHEVSAKGRKLKVLQSAINTDSTGIGKSVFYSIKKANQVQELATSSLHSVLWGEKLVGDYLDLTTDNVTSLSEKDRANYIKDRIAEGYIQLGNQMIRPTSLGGFAAVYATLTNNKLWSKYFPYESGGIFNAISSTLINKIERPTSVNEQAKEMSNSMNSYKSLLISDTFKLFSNYGSTLEARQDLLFDTEEHLSLGSILYDIKAKGNYTNLFLDRLQVGRPGVAIDIQGMVPTDINYFKAGEVEMDDEQVTKIIADMIIKAEPLGEYNGRTINSRELIDMLITHQMITGGIQKSTQFIKYLPYAYLERKGYFNKINNSILSDDISNDIIRKTFQVQYIQHNPEQYYREENEQYTSEVKEDGNLYLDEGVSMNNPFIILKAGGDRYNIYMYNAGMARHEQIDSLGWKGMTEYSMDSIVGRSSVYINKVDDSTDFPLMVNEEESYKDVFINNDNNIPNEESTAAPIYVSKRTPVEGTKSLKKQAFIRGIGENTITEEGYKLILKDYLNTNFYLIKERKYYTAFHSDSGKFIPLNQATTIKEAINNFEYAINRAMQLESNNKLLNEIGFTNATSAHVPNITDAADFLRIDRDKSNDLSPITHYGGVSMNMIDQFYLNDNNLSIEDKQRLILKEIKDNSTNPVMSYIAGKMGESITILSGVPIYIDSKLGAKGTLRSSNIIGEPLQIRINPTKINSEEEMREVLLEEMIHGVLKSQISQGSSPFVKSLNNIMSEVKAQMIREFGEDNMIAVERKIKDRQALTQRERDLFYPLINLDEFVAATINNKVFQQYLNKSEATYTTQSLWQKLIKAITDLLESLGVKKDSNLESALHEVINLFDDVNKTLYNELNRPQFVRTISYLNEKFNLTDVNNSPLVKTNADEIARFINSTIVNVTAKVIDGTVELQSNTLTDFIETNSVDIESGIGGNLMVYIQTLSDRIKKLQDNIRKAKETEDYIKVEALEWQLEQEQDKYRNIKDTQSLVHLADKADEDMQVVDRFLNAPMNSEDIVYVRNIVNFWSNAKEHIFDERHNNSLPLATLYGGIESKAEVRALQLFEIEKKFLQGEIKKYLGKDADIDKIFEDYKDINVLQKNLRDISTYDNTLLNTIWASLKLANNDTLDEGTALLGNLEEQLDRVIPELRKLGNKELFEPYRQLTERGKATNHLVNPFTPDFYKEKAKVLRRINDDNRGTTVNDYVKWLRKNGMNTNIRKIFPLDGVVTKETTKAREEMRTKLGAGIYDYWFVKQQTKIDKYNKAKDAYLEILMDENGFKTREELINSKEPYNSYQAWTKRNSPYTLEEVVFEGKKFKDDYFNLRNKDYYEVIPDNEAYFDNNFTVIANNPILLEFYNKVDEVFNYLKKYVPLDQQKTLAYRGIPSIEKAMIEMYSERGMQLGFAPIGDALVKSMQTSFADVTATETDILTGKAKRDLRIPIIRDSYKEIQNYVDVKTAEYIEQNKKAPSDEQIKEFEEDVIDEISRRNSFDLGKILKVYTSLALAHKHKSKIEDSIKIANTVLDSYQEMRTRPDGTPETDRQTGAIQRKAKGESFLNTKESLDNFVSNVMYGDVRDEEGKGKKIYTPTEKKQRAEYTRLINSLDTQFEQGLIEEDVYLSAKDNLQKQLSGLGKTMIYSKAGDNVLKYIQLKLMGWNVLGGVSNMGFGYIANQLEAAGGQFITRAELNDAYRMTGSSVVKNATFNKVESDTAKKIRNGMNKWDVMKEASQELYTSSTPSSMTKSTQWLQPYNMNQRTEYLNQAPLMIALAKKTKVQTNAGEISIWEGYDNNFNWNTEKYGAEPTEAINKMRMRLDQIIKRTHGNYDNLSPLLAKRKFLGRAASQFRTWMFESIATRFEAERYDDILDGYVKGRYRSVGTVFTGTKLGQFAPELMKGILKQWSLGLLFKNADFKKLIDGNNIKEIDAINMNKVAKEITFAINIYLFLLLITALIGDDDDDKEMVNILINQGTRLKTDLVMYLNPMEARNIIKDPIPAMSVVSDVNKWFSSVGGLFTDEDEVKAGVHAGDSRFARATMKLIPFASKVESTTNSASQVFDKN